MADISKETHVEKTTTEIDEVQNFGGGEVKSVEPVADVHHEYHYYSGGQFVERANTTISPWLLTFWGFVLFAIVGVLFYYGAIPGVHVGGASYPYNPERTAKGYMEVQKDMTNYITTVPNTPQNYIPMSQLNQAIGGGKSLQANIDAGTDVYQHNCIGCHGPNQDGAGPNSVNLNPMPRNLRNAPFMQAMSLQRIETSIHKGVPGTAMPRWENTLDDTQINEAIIYVLSLTAPVDETGKFIDPLSGKGQDLAVPAGPSAPIGSSATPVGQTAVPAASQGAPASPASVAAHPATPGATTAQQGTAMASPSAPAAPTTGTTTPVSTTPVGGGEGQPTKP